MSATVNHPIEIVLWGCLGGGRVALVQPVEGSINTHAYISIMRHCLEASRHQTLGDGPFIFPTRQRPLSCLANNSALVRAPSHPHPHPHHGVATAEPRPALHWAPSRTLWALVKKRVHAMGPFAKAAQLRDAGAQCWGEIEQDSLLALVRCMAERVAQVIGRGVGQTSL